MADKKRGRAPGFHMGPEHRLKIANSNILSRLIKHAEGHEPDMQTSEVTAGLSLLDRIMPKLQATTISGDQDNPVAIEDVGQGAAKLAAVLDAIASRTTSEPE